MPARTAVGVARRDHRRAGLAVTRARWRVGRAHVLALAAHAGRGAAGGRRAVPPATAAVIGVAIDVHAQVAASRSTVDAVETTGCASNARAKTQCGLNELRVRGRKAVLTCAILVGLTINIERLISLRGASVADVTTVTAMK